MSFLSNLFENSFEKEIEDLISPEKNLIGNINSQHLEVSDLLKTKKYNPKQFVTSLVKVMKKTTNGNIIINILSLLDTCIKNAGQGFYLELNTITLIEQLQRILREFDVNVRTKTKEHVQYWALLFKNNSEMFMFVDLYENLKRMGVDFPSVTIPISSALVETKLAPPWSDSENCNRCRTVFTTFNRKHHCRNCGKVFCQDCSSKSIPLPALGLTDAVRVCDTCHYKITTGNASSIITNSPLKKISAVKTNSDEDDDLQRAIEASLKVSGGYQSQTSATKEKVVKFSESIPQSSDDDERAIKESLLEAERVKASPSKTTNFSKSGPSSYDSTRFGSEPQYSRPSPQPDPPPVLITARQTLELTPTQLQNISLFSSLVSAQSHEISVKGYDSFSPGQLQVLFENVSGLYDILGKCVEEAAEGYKNLYEMNEALNEVVGIYDGFCKQRMMYGGQGTYNTGGYGFNSVSQGNANPAFGAQLNQGYTQNSVPQIYSQAPPLSTGNAQFGQQSYSNNVPQSVGNNPQGYLQDLSRQQSYTQVQAPGQGSPFSPPVQNFPNQPYQGSLPIQQSYSPQQIPGQPQAFLPAQAQYQVQPSQPQGVLQPQVVPEAPQDAPLIEL